VIGINSNKLLNTPLVDLGPQVSNNIIIPPKPRKSKIKPIPWNTGPEGGVVRPMFTFEEQQR